MREKRRYEGPVLGQLGTIPFVLRHRNNELAHYCVTYSQLRKFQLEPFLLAASLLTNHLSYLLASLLKDTIKVKVLAKLKVWIQLWVYFNGGSFYILL